MEKIRREEKKRKRKEGRKEERRDVVSRWHVRMDSRCSSDARQTLVPRDAAGITSRDWRSANPCWWYNAPAISLGIMWIVISVSKSGKTHDYLSEKIQR